MAFDRNKKQPPFIPYGAIIPDPCLIEVPITTPIRINLDREICKVIEDDTSPNKVCYTYWDSNCELPEIPIQFIIDLYLSEKVEFYPGQILRFQKIKKQAEVVRLKRNGLGPGWFEVEPVNMSEEEYWESIGSSEEFENE